MGSTGDTTPASGTAPVTGTVDGVASTTCRSEFVESRVRRATLTIAGTGAVVTDTTVDTDQTRTGAQHAARIARLPPIVPRRLADLWSAITVAKFAVVAVAVAACASDPPIWPPKRPTGAYHDPD